MSSNKESLRENQLTDDTCLIREAEVFSSYIIDRPPKAKAVSLYIMAHQNLDQLVGLPSEKAMVDFVSQRPWSVTFLDTYYSVFKPHSLLRRKILIFAAILEVSPDEARQFLPQHFSVVGLIRELSLIPILILIKLPVGVVLNYFWERRIRA